MAHALLNTLTEPLIKDTIGPARFTQAEVQLAAGKVIQRRVVDPSKISAWWDKSNYSPVMEVSARGKSEILMLCSCKEFSSNRQFGCQHLDALLIAWVREPNTFESIGDDELDDESLLSGLLGFMDGIEDDLLDDEDEEDLFDDEEDFPSEPLDLAFPSLGQQVRAFDPVQSYQDFLSKMTLPDIREVARRRGVTVTGQRKDAVVESLARALARPEKFTEDWPSLSPQARRLAGLIPFLNQQWAAPDEWTGVVREAGLRTEKAADEALEELRLFGVATVDRNYGQIYFPSILTRWLPPDPQVAPALTKDLNNLRVQDAPPPGDFQRKVTRLLLLLRSEGFQVIARRKAENSRIFPYLTGWHLDSRELDQVLRNSQPAVALHKQGVTVLPAPALLDNESLERLAANMHESPDWVDWILHLLAREGIVQAKPDKRLQVEPGMLAELFKVDSLQLGRILLSSHAGLLDWTEMDLALKRANSLKLRIFDQYRSQYEQYLRFLNLFRQKIMLLISRQPAGQWVDMAELSNLVSRLPLRTNLEMVSRVVNIIVQGQPIQFNRVEDRQKAQWVQNLYLEMLLSGPLYWQGVVDLAWENDHLAAYRLTDYGAALLLTEKAYQLPVPEGAGPALRFSAQGGLQLNLDAGGGELVGLLAMIGEPGITEQGELEYRPTVEGAARAFGSGWTPERLLKVLEEHAGLPVPQPLAERFSTWWGNYGSLQLYGDVALIELNDDFALNELLAGTALSRHLLFRFSPRLVAIRPEGVEELREEMIKKGYTPRLA